SRSLCRELFPPLYMSALYKSYRKSCRYINSNGFTVSLTEWRLCMRFIRHCVFGLSLLAVPVVATHAQDDSDPGAVHDAVTSEKWEADGHDYVISRQWRIDRHDYDLSRRWEEIGHRYEITRRWDADGHSYDLSRR